MDEFFDGDHKMVSEIYFLLVCSKLLLLFSKALHTPQSYSWPQCSGWGKKEVGLFGSISHGWGIQVLTHRLSRSTVGEMTGQEDLSWYRAVPPWGVMRGEVKLFFLPFSMSPSRIFCSNGILKLLHWTAGLLHNHYHPHVIVKISVLWGRMVENSYSTMLFTDFIRNNTYIML